MKTFRFPSLSLVLRAALTLPVAFAAVASCHDVGDALTFPVQDDGGNDSTTGDDSSVSADDAASDSTMGMTEGSTGTPDTGEPDAVKPVDGESPDTTEPQDGGDASTVDVTEPQDTGVDSSTGLDSSEEDAEPDQRRDDPGGDAAADGPVGADASSERRRRRGGRDLRGRIRCVRWRRGPRAVHDRQPHGVRRV